MPNVEWSEIAAEAMDRDPRKFPVGYLTGGSFVLDSVRVFVWFKDIPELLEHLHDVEPRVYDLEPGDGLEEYQAAIAPILAELAVNGLRDDLRRALVPVISADFVVDWWGRFEDLCSGSDELGIEARASFLDLDIDEAAKQPIPEESLDEFVEYLKTWRV